MQHLKLSSDIFPIPQLDARISGTGISPPPNLLLDFMYGVAAYRRWGGGQDISEVMQHRYTEHYKSIPIPPPSPSSSDGDSSPGQRMSNGLLDAMDNVLMLSMLLKGRTPQSMAAERQRREEEEELHTQKAGQAKARQWIQAQR
jgi:hypothetical protein